MANSLFVLQLVLPAPAERWLPPNITDKQAREAWFGFSAVWRKHSFVPLGGYFWFANQFKNNYKKESAGNLFLGNGQQENVLIIAVKRGKKGNLP